MPHDIRVASTQTLNDTCMVFASHLQSGMNGHAHLGPLPGFLDDNAAAVTNLLHSSCSSAVLLLTSCSIDVAILSYS
eukprot:82546-Chlamydomonas_euryale.AAC.5